MMTPYSTVVLAADLTEESTLLADRMKQIIGDKPCAVHIVHVIEPLSAAYGGDVPMDLSPVQDQIQDQAKAHLTEFGRQLGIPEDRQHLIFGRPQSEIHRAAEECGADLIVVGSHTRSGLARLLGSTANGVMDSAPCDVLAVRVGEA
jgi:universal stress protein A